jgi:hypothetical protein
MMKIIIAALALAAMAFAAPADGFQKRQACAPATYSCTPDSTGWQVCDVSGVWDVSELLPRGLGQNANSSPTTVRRLLPTRHRLRFLPAQPLAVLCASRLRYSIINALPLLVHLFALDTGWRWISSGNCEWVSCRFLAVRNYRC